MPSEHSYHDVRVRIEDGPARMERMPGHNYDSHRTGIGGFEDDPRWPARCACGYEFVSTDTSQVFGKLIYIRADGAWWPMDQIPIGGMLEAVWMSDYPAWSGPDGKALMVKLPPGGEHDWWLIDGPSSGGGRWARSGTPPDISVSPSISTPRYHGFLGSSSAPGPGWLSDPL